MCMNTSIDSDECLQTIEDFVFNEDKIVTYKWLSGELNVHINTAKQLLHAFTKKPHENEELLVTYAVSGFTLEGGGLNITLVKENELKKIKKLFKQVISEHVYSVQKASPSASIHDLYTVDVDTIKPDEQYCSIHIDGDIIRKDLGKTYTFPSGTKPPEKTVVSKNIPDKNAKKGNQDSGIINRNSQNSSNDKTNKAKNESTTKTTATTEKKLHENSKAGNDSPNKEVKKTGDTSPNKEVKKTGNTSPKKAVKKPTKNTPPSKTGSIGAFFNRQAAINTEKSKNAAVKKAEGPPEETENVPNNAIKIANPVVEKPDNKKITNEKSSKSNDTGKKEKKTAAKRKKSAKEEDHSNKRRKRIMIASDSESSADEMDVEEEPEPPSPEPPPVSKPESDEEVIPPTPSEKGRKRVRKQISKVFKDEDGFLITKKENVYESCSDDELEPPKTDKVEDTLNKSTDKPKNESPKNGSPHKNKQASITNFFKRKV